MSKGSKPWDIVPDWEPGIFYDRKEIHIPVTEVTKEYRLRFASQVPIYQDLPEEELIADDIRHEFGHSRTTSPGRYSREKGYPIRQLERELDAQIWAYFRKPDSHLLVAYLGVLWDDYYEYLGDSPAEKFEQLVRESIGRVRKKL